MVVDQKNFSQDNYYTMLICTKQLMQFFLKLKNFLSSRLAGQVYNEVERAFSTFSKKEQEKKEIGQSFLNIFKKKKKKTYSVLIQPVINDDKHSMLCSISLVEEIRGFLQNEVPQISKSCGMSVLIFKHFWNIDYH